MLGRKKSFPKPQLVHFAELCSKNEALCLMWRAEVGTSAEGFKVNPGPWPAPAPASPGSLQFPPAAIPGCCQAPSWPPSGHLAPIPGRRRRRPRSICTNSRSTAQRPLCYELSVFKLVQLKIHGSDSFLEFELPGISLSLIHI